MPGSAGPEGPVVYVDLAYLPSGSASSTVDHGLFKRLRASYYIISGDDPAKEAAMRRILDGLLAGKSTWPDDPVGGAFPNFLSSRLDLPSDPFLPLTYR